ncbi:MAG TPA: VOC family protein [Acidimicrobiia bacterium]|nr:VOC family protein [Acidimicrobiia bacterium]
MPGGPFAHVAFLVFDLDRAIEDWTRILGVLDPGQLEAKIVRSEKLASGDDTVRWATFVSETGTEIQLVEPQPDTPLGRRLARHGEHIHHLCFTTDDVSGAVSRLEAAGVAVTGGRDNTDPALPWQRWSWISPESAHGVLIEVAKPYEARDGRWEPKEPG